MDFSDFIEDEAAVRNLVSEKGRFDFKDFLEHLPQTPLANYAFINKRNTQFDNEAKALGLDQKGYSNGSAYADLDNDGDLDLILNNVNQPVWIYENKTNTLSDNNFIKIRFHGDKNNPFGIGATVKIKNQQEGELVFQNYQSRGFQSATEPILTIGIGSVSSIEEVEITWPGGKNQIIKNIKANTTVDVKYVNASSVTIAQNQKKETIFTKSIRHIDPNIAVHKENLFSDFDFERLLPHMVSTEGPEILVGDINGDELEDFILLGASDQSDQVFFQNNGRFNLSESQLGLQADKASESVCGLLTDMDNDNDLDLLIGVGGNDPNKDYGNYIFRMYANDGQGVFTPVYFEGLKAIGNFSCITEFDLDGNKALFIGSRIVPGNYGLSPRNYLFVQENGLWVDKTTREIGQIGMVTDASATDIDGDGDEDLIIVGEWIPITVFENINGNLELKGSVNNSNGLWQSIEALDVDSDGDLDFAVGNWGLNSKLQASSEKQKVKNLP